MKQQMQQWSKLRQKRMGRSGKQLLQDNGPFRPSVTRCALICWILYGRYVTCLMWSVMYEEKAPFRLLGVLLCLCPLLELGPL